MMPLLPVNVLQPPLPFLPPRLSSAIHWIIRIILLIGTIITFPFFLVYIPISIFLRPKNAILHLHPHNLPPHCSFLKACGRGYWAYGASGFLWSITSIGLAPDFGLGMSRWLAKRGLKKAERVARAAGSILEGRLVVSEETIPPLARELCIGVLDGDDLARNSVHCFWLDHVPISEELDSSKPRKTKKVILWLAGGGYVSGHPLNDRPIFSLARNLPPGYRILAPAITRALSLERSFPLSLLDGLASYAYLRKVGYEAKDITVIGNSAGGGLSWSILSYLVAMVQGGKGSLGVPRAVAMISPWLKLPPSEAGLYPDFVNTPQLKNAASCYLARYPSTSYDSWTYKGPVTHLDWFNESTFTNLSAHHPLISPAADTSSPFVQYTLKVLAKRRTKMLIHYGTAEWFYGPGLDFANAAKGAGVDLDLVENEGGLHSEACLSWPERGGPAEVLQQSLLACLP